MTIKLIFGMVIILFAISNGFDMSDVALGPLGTSLAFGFPLNFGKRSGLEGLL